MEAPELPTKIYFTILDMGSGYVYTPSLDDNGGTEYIRKDALMEIINVEKTRHTERRSVEGIAACHALNNLIKQLELYDIK